MASLELLKRWKVTSTLLLRASRAIPQEPKDTQDQILEFKKQFHEFLEHNELGLALNCLEDIAALVPCRGGFWRDLERAAKIMGLNERALVFGKQFLAAKTNGS